MPLPPSDRALRRAVAQLAAAASEDIEAVLQELDPRQRETVLGLLGELVGGAGAAPDDGDDAAAVARRIGLSPWLVTRVCGEAPGQRGVNLRGDAITAAVQRDFVMTPTAAAALRASVLEAEQSGQASAQAASVAWWRRLRQGVPAMTGG